MVLILNWPPNPTFVLKAWLLASVLELLSRLFRAW